MKSENIYRVLIADQEDKSLGSDALKNQVKQFSYNHNINYEVIYQKANGSYRNIVTDETYTEEDFVGKLVPINRILNIPEHISKKRFLKIYRSYLNEFIKLGDIYIGDIGMVTGGENPLVEHKDNGICVSINLNVIEIAQNRILVKGDKQFIDISNHIKYYDTNISIGQLRVVRSTLLSSYLEKGEIEEVIEDYDGYSIRREKVLKISEKLEKRKR